MVATNYNNRPMTDLSDRDYETLLAHLTEQVAAVIPRYVAGPDDQRYDAASDALTNEWQPERTAREWLAAAGKRLGVDTSGCRGV